jgi:hypothetical protein
MFAPDGEICLRGANRLSVKYALCSHLTQLHLVHVNSSTLFLRTSLIVRNGSHDYPHTRPYLVTRNRIVTRILLSCVFQGRQRRIIPFAKSDVVGFIDRIESCTEVTDKTVIIIAHMVNCLCKTNTEGWEMKQFYQYKCRHRHTHIHTYTRTRIHIHTHAR